jgi:hypothetical protein
MELAAVLLALAAGLFVLVRRHAGPPRVLAGGCALLAVAGASIRGPAPDRELAAAIPAQHRDEGFVSSSACRSCHPFHFETWHDSYHRSMTQAATPAAVLGDFGDLRLRTRGRETRLWRDGETFWAELVDPLFDLRYTNTSTADLPPAPRIRARVVMTTGSHHLQTYWIRRPAEPTAVGGGLPADDGALLQLPWIWHIGEQRWIPTQDSFLIPPSERVAAGTPWNVSCSPCHSVGTRPELADETFATESAELGIACEACHGPGQAHVEANRDPLRRYRLHLAGAADETIVNPARLPKERSAEVCGQCHSFHREIDLAEASRTGISFRPGEQLADHKRVFARDSDPEDPLVREQLKFEPDMLDGRFWKDGTIRVAGREYNGMLESACFTRGAMTCLSCHALHGYVEAADQLRPEATDDRACAQCHVEIAADPAAHSRHEAGTAGASCVNCHMPFTTWGLFTAMRSHRIDRPSAAVSATTGRPNACNQCHVDQPLGWTAEHLSAWFEQPPVADLPDEHREVSATLVWALRGDAAQRAIAAWTLGWSEARRASGSGWQAVVLSMLLSDPYAAVRKAAYDALRPLPGYGADFAYDFVPPERAQRQVSSRAMARWAGQRATFLDRRGPRVLIDDRGEPDQDRIMDLYRRRDDTPVRIIE